MKRKYVGYKNSAKIKKRVTEEVEKLNRSPSHTIENILIARKVNVS